VFGSGQSMGALGTSIYGPSVPNVFSRIYWRFWEMRQHNSAVGARPDLVPFVGSLLSEEHI
jgi:hypothetical protein